MTPAEAARLADLESQALGCTRCPLAQGRTNVVFGVGNPGAGLMFIGEGPGHEEDIRGEPFVGRSGKLLDLLMKEELGIDRTGCYIANVVKCLSFTTPVQLGDGSWERVGRLVHRRYTGTVMSVAPDGSLVERPVTGWHASPLNGRRVFNLRYRRAERAGANGYASTQLTGDHEVLTEDGWLPVEQLRNGARIATGRSAFGEGDRVVLPGGLERLGLPARVRHSRLHSDVLTTRKPAVTVAPFVAPSMRHKLLPDVAETVSFDPRLFEDRTPQVLFDEAVVEEVDHVDPHRTFYCIDVAGTHNFVTSGGVVHNCRPPGNRDPRPEEIDACRPYLESQIDLISPRVVVTLGNFATRLLLDTTAGIRSLRGKVYPFRTGLVVPTYHPSAALRSGGQVVAEMRADLIRAKEALAVSRG